MLFLLICTVNLSAQQNDEVFQFALKSDSSYIFIDNSNRNWYTLEFVTDTLFNIEKNIYFYNGKSIQIGSVQFDNQNTFGVRGSTEAEKLALLSYKKWELDYQKRVSKAHLKSGQEFYYGNNLKPFLVWWFENPRKSKVPDREIEFTTIKSYHKINLSDSLVLRATHQLFLGFIIQGNTSVHLSIPVLENETLEEEINQLKKIANTLNVYGSYVDLRVLSDRMKSKENIIMKDSLHLIEIEIPSWANVCKSPYKDIFSISFPEKENIVNALAILCEPKSDSFDTFKNKYMPKKIDPNSLKLINKQTNKEQYFFTDNNTYFYGQSIFLEGEKTYCYINFIATRTTYDFNLARLYELVGRIKMK